MVILDNKEVGRSKWTIPGNSALVKEFTIELHKNRELEIDILARDSNHQALCGLIYLRLEDIFNANAATFSLPLIPQGILQVEATYEIPKMKPQRPKKKIGQRIFKCEPHVWVGV